MGTPTPIRRLLMRNIPRLSRTPGSATPITRSLPKEVFLYEWWLVRAATGSDGNHLHVAGFTSRGRQVKEIFHSTSIVKRYDTVTVESVDGITISISGFINRFRTLENGFSNEVCDKFLLGFPYNWEEFATAFDRVSPSEANPQLSETRSSLKYTLPLAFEDLSAVAIRDLFMSIPEDSESSMMNIVVENIWKSYAGSGGKMTDCIKAPCSSCTGGNMTDFIKAPCSSCSGGKRIDSLKEDASHGMNDDSFMNGNQTRYMETAVMHGHTVIHVVPETTSSVGRRVEILQNPQDDFTMAGDGVRENINSASEKPLEGSCIDSHASITTANAGVENINSASEKPLEGSCIDSHANITTAGAGVRENMNTASEKCLKGSCLDSHASKTQSKPASIKERHMGSLVDDSQENMYEITISQGDSKDLFVDNVVPQSCNRNKNTSGADVTASEKCLKGSCLDSLASKTQSKPASIKEGHMSSLVDVSEENTYEITVNPANSKDLFVDNAVPQSCNRNKNISFKRKKNGRPRENDLSLRVTRSMKRQRKISYQETSAMSDVVTPAVVLDTPKMQSHVTPSRCQVSNTSELSKAQSEAEKVEESHKSYTLRRSTRLQERKQHVS